MCDALMGLNGTKARKKIRILSKYVNIKSQYSMVYKKLELYLEQISH